MQPITLTGLLSCALLFSSGALAAYEARPCKFTDSESTLHFQIKDAAEGVQGKDASIVKASEIPLTFAANHRMTAYEYRPNNELVNRVLLVKDQMTFYNTYKITDDLVYIVQWDQLPSTGGKATTYIYLSGRDYCHSHLGSLTSGKIASISVAKLGPKTPGQESSVGKSNVSTSPNPIKSDEKKPVEKNAGVKKDKVEYSKDC